MAPKRKHKQAATKGRHKRPPASEPANSWWFSLTPALICCMSLLLATRWWVASPESESEAVGKRITFSSDPALDALGDTRFAVRPSNIVGGGLGTFARRSFKKGARLGRYYCGIFNKKDRDENFNADYVWSINETHSCNGMDLKQKNPLRYVNSVASRETCGIQNAQMRIKLLGPDDTMGPYYYATRDVEIGDEILVDYGENYFNNAKYVTAGITHECAMPEFHVACGRGDLELARDLYSAQAHEKKKVMLERPSAGNLARAPLIVAAARGHGAVIAWLLEQGANINVVANHHQTALWVASEYGQVETVTILLKGGASIDQADDDGVTPLYVAAQGGHVEVVTALRKGGASIDKVNHRGTTPLFIASQYGHVEVVTDLLKDGVSIDQARGGGITPLFISSERGHVEVVTALLKGGASIDKAGDRGLTPLFIASERGHTEVVKALLKAGAGVDKLVDGGATPLLIACERGHTEVVKALLEAGAGVDKPMDGGATPIHIATYYGHVDVVRALLKGGAIPDALFRRDTPLDIARKKGHTEMVTTLLKATKNGERKTLL